jgi:hypothetical protein
MGLNGPCWFILNIILQLFILLIFLNIGETFWILQREERIVIHIEFLSDDKYLLKINLSILMFLFMQKIILMESKNK